MKLYLIISAFYFQKLESLTLHPLDASPTALETFCAAMPHITKIDFSFANCDNRYDRVLRAIAANMHHLKSLSISFCTVDHSKAIEYLLPMEDNVLGGCPELVHLDLLGVDNVHAESLKKIILALPKLRSLKHGLLVKALADITEEEMDEDTVRCLNSLYVSLLGNGCSYICCDIMAKSPVFQRFRHNITTIYIREAITKDGQKESSLSADALWSLPNLEHITLCYTSETEQRVLHLLESSGDRVKYLRLELISANLSVQNILRTCRNLVNLSLIYKRFIGISQRSGNKHHDQVEWPSKLSVLHYLTELYLYQANKSVCSAEILIALLQFPNLSKITLHKLEAMSDDVMFNVLSSRGCAALSKVSEFTVKQCPLITEEPLILWLTRENCSLQYIGFHKCEKINHEKLRAGAEKYPKPLMIEEL